MKLRMTNANPAGHTFHYWEDSTGTLWACVAYDHGPMCRRCHKVEDETMEHLIENVLHGYLWVYDRPDLDDLTFKLTPEGEKHVEEIVAGDPELRRLYEVAGLELMYEASPSSESH